VLVDYISNLERAVELCDQFEAVVEGVYFDDGKAQQSFLPHFCLEDFYKKNFEPVKACVQMLQILRSQSIKKHESFIYQKVSELESSESMDLEGFKFNLKVLKSTFETVKDDRLAFCSTFDEEEKGRMNEAIHDYLEDCNYSCVAMSVSAVESRLVKLMCLVSPDSKQRLEKKTLGQLVTEYLKNKSKYKTVVPNKHDHLLQLCNTYRIYSVHPKQERIKPTVAGSILTLAIEFLTDHDTDPEVVKAKLAA
jgi:hypothetical protein